MNNNIKQEGQKFDNGKLPMFTVLFKQFPNAIGEVVRCSNSGHNKYPNDIDWMNFQRVDTEKDGKVTYLEASVRHLTESKGELIWNEDMEEYGGALHLAQSIWNQLAHLELLILNDRDSKLKEIKISLTPQELFTLIEGIFSDGQHYTEENSHIVAEKVVNKYLNQ